MAAGSLLVGTWNSEPVNRKDVGGMSVGLLHLRPGSDCHLIHVPGGDGFVKCPTGQPHYSLLNKHQREIVISSFWPGPSP